MSSLVDAILADARADIRLGCPVARVEHGDGAANVTAVNGTEFRGRACVLALPFNALGAIEISPLLSDEKRRALDEGAPSGGFKLWVRLRESVESCLCMAAGDEPLMFARYEAKLPSGSLLGCYGADRTLLGTDVHAVAQQAIESWLPGCTVDEYWIYDWADDEFSRETWRVPRPGQYTRFAAEFERGEGALVIAGSDYARGWTGFMDGAVESGLSSARAVATIASAS
jgi:monoamine oxidase